MRTNRANIVLAIFFLLPWACVKPLDEKVRQQMMDSQVERRLDTYIRQQRTACYERILEEAVAMVDSTFRVDPISISLDTIGRPPLPIKPGSPNFQLPNDSVILEPLITADNL